MTKMTRLKFLELALEGARLRMGLAQDLSEYEWGQLHADVNYIDARLKDERTRLALKERNKGALRAAFEKGAAVLEESTPLKPLTPRAKQYLEQFK